VGVHERGRFSQIMITKVKCNYGGSNHLLSSVDFPVNNKTDSQGSPIIYGIYSLRGSVVGCGTIQARRSRDRVPMRWIFFNLPNPSSRTMALRSTQPLTEISTVNLPGSKGRPVHRADNLTTIYEPTV
jgi:hypothetical protein